MAGKAELLTILQRHGQQHLLAFWDALDADAQQSLAGQIAQIDFELVARLYAARGQQAQLHEWIQRAEPPSACYLDASRNRFTPEQGVARGEEALKAGQVGAILVAGGQGSRLGFDHPKGMYPIGPVSNYSLFAILIGKLRAVARRSGARIPLYVMTSPSTHQETAAFLAEHDRFGLPEEDLRLFCQGTMPAVDAATGKLLLESPGRLATSPDGHGGMLAAFARSGAMDDARRRGLRQLFYFQVDNPLVDVCGAKYIGYHLLHESEMTTQVVAKRNPLERVGNVVRVGDRLAVIEYSDLPEESARRRNPDGSLAIWAGSIAVHVFDVAFLERAAGQADALPFHLARKKVPCLDAGGKVVQPQGPNAVKFERFIFDLMPWARNALVVEVDPAWAFAPVKNAPGAATDSPEWVKAQMVALHRQWLLQAGAEVAADVPVEISPLFALDAAELAAKLPPGTRISEPRYLCE
jgi:UDP-N-acetylglucosamine/UDP-N-acetylgalactosamine diphosphorylase